jgi:tRNA-Thr(GGU) m(6)t(6)A37 methyltransferase TsaA
VLTINTPINQSKSYSEKSEDLPSQINLTAIGKVNSPYKEKFAIPRQPGLVSAAKGEIVLQGETNNIDLVRGLEQFSHIWVVFVFHGTQDQGWKPLVKPPRLGGNKKIGALATRSTFRPNPIGMSVVKLEGIREEKNATGDKTVILDISSLDLLDGTPVIDIKPYVPYSDAINNAEAGFAQAAPENAIQVVFSEQAKLDLRICENKHTDIAAFIEQVLNQDPRPAYKKGKPDNKVYGMCLYDLNILWQVVELNTIEVLSIK